MFNQPVLTGLSGRQFAGFAAAVLVFVVDERGRILMLAHPELPGRWEVINGAMEAGNTVLEAVLRETHEEAGPHIRVRPLGAFHAYTFRYDDAVPHMISIAYLCAYEGGEIVPGDDMAGSEVHWWGLDDIEREKPYLLVPHDQPWTLERAVELYWSWKDRNDVQLQPPLEGTKNKYER